MYGLPKERIRDLILSIGTHKKDRRLSPIEVAESFQIAINNNATKTDLANLVQLKDLSIIVRFLNLLKLNPKIKNFVGWGKNNATISFISASIISKLDFDKQEIIAKAIMENKLNKNEIIQIIQIHERSGKPFDQCIQEIFNMRPLIEKIFVFIGTITDQELIKNLSKMSQSQRDILLRSIIEKKMIITEEWDCRLGNQNFSLSGGESLATQLNQLKPDFEYVITEWLSQEGINVK